MNDSATVPPSTDTPTCQALAACTVKDHGHVLAGWFSADGGGFIREHELRSLTVPWTMPGGTEGLMGATLIVTEEYRDGRMACRAPQILIDADSVLLDRTAASALAAALDELLAIAESVTLPAPVAVSADLR